jgi:hypothetical protein
MSTHSRHRFGLIEFLEARCMMAGNVTATQTGPDLELVGDDLGNVISIRQSAPGAFAVFGEDTTVNGSAASSTPVEFTGVTGSISVRLHGGDDRLIMVQHDAPIDIGEGLIIETGDGNDHVQLASFRLFTTGSALVVDLGTGNDGLVERSVIIGTDHVVQGGPGNDSILMEGASPRRNMAVHLGDGYDAMRYLGSVVTNSLLIDGGADADLLQLQHVVMYNDSAVFGRDGADLIQTEQLRAYGTFLVNSGADFGYIEVKIAGFFRDCYLIGEGPTQGLIEFSRIVRLEIITGPVGDSFSLDRCVVDNFFAALGEASDRLAIVSSRIDVRGRLDGQGGFDVFHGRGNILTNVEWLNFEHFE